MANARRRLWLLGALAVVALVAGGVQLYFEQLRIAAAFVPPNYTLLEPGLYIGGNGPKPADATAVLSLTPIPDDYRADVYSWQPIGDALPAPTLDWLRQQVQFVDSQRLAGRTVFVHCDAGRSRSALVVVAYYMWRDHVPVAEALKAVKAKRPVQPNKGFMALLGEWEKSLAAESAPAGKN